MFDSTKIIACGSYLPKNIVTNDDLSKKIDTSHEWIFQRTGIEQRHIANENETTSYMGYQALKNAIDKYEITPESIDGIIVATTTPDLTFPSTASMIQNKLNSFGGFAFDIQAVCGGFLYGLSVANAMLKSNYKRIAIICSERLSNILNWEDRTTCVLFGDGAGCVILEGCQKASKSRILDIQIGCDASYNHILQTNGGIGTNQLTGHICMDGKEVFKYATNYMVRGVEEILAKNNILPDEIDYIVSHQANSRILSHVAKKLNLDIEKVILTVNKHANTSAASIPLALDDSIKSGKITISSGQLLLMQAVGGGMTNGTCLVRI